YGPDKARRAVAATTDPATLPPLTTWYLATDLPHPDAQAAREAPLGPADLGEVVRLYGLRNWVEQSYKQTKDELGWADFMVRSDRAIRRHWQLVFCAFSFCWRARFAEGEAAGGEPTPQVADSALAEAAGAPLGEGPAPAESAWGENPAKRQSRRSRAAGVVAGDAAAGAGLAGPLGHALALVARLVGGAPAARTPSPPRLTRQRQTPSHLSPLLTNYR